MSHLLLPVTLVAIVVAGQVIEGAVRPLVPFIVVSVVTLAIYKLMLQCRW